MQSARADLKPPPGAFSFSEPKKETTTMATPAQTLANQANAQHSTGPRTEDGKAKAALNAVRHNLTSRGLIVPLGLEATFAGLEGQLRADLIPEGGMQETIFTRILECSWNLHRCRLAQTQLFEKSTDLAIDPLLDDQNEAKFARIDKYARQCENSMYKGMRELGKLQTETEYRHTVNPLTEEQLENQEIFEQTPQGRSVLCDFQQVHAVTRRAPKLQNKADSNRAAMAFLDMVTAPPARMPAPDIARAA